MEKATAKGFWGVFLIPTVFICVLICIAGVVYASANVRLIEPLATLTEPAPVLAANTKQLVAEAVQMRVTAYCPCEKCCGKWADGVTACGHKIRPGDAFVAADKEYPFDTEMIIAGYNNGKPVQVLDRGGAIYGNRLDVFFGNHEEALEWGVRYIEVKIQPR